jgi:hypothetical protein
MRRMFPGLLSITFLLSMLVSMPVVGQTSAPKSDEHKATARKPLPPPWKIVKGLKIAKVPPATDQEPEFAIMRLSANEYKEFKENPKEFVNKHHLFSHDVKVLDSCPEAQPPKGDPPTDGSYYIMMPHWPGSTAMCTAYPSSPSH